MVITISESTMVIASIAAWFTPTILFCVSNLIIVTLFVASKSSNKRTTVKQHDHDHNHNHDQGYSFTQSIPKVSSLSEQVKSVKLSSIIPIIESPKEYISIPKIAKYTSLSRLAQSIYYTCDYDSQPDSPRYPSNKPKPNPPSPSQLGRLKSIDFSSNHNLNNSTISTEPEQVSNSPSQLLKIPSFFDRVKSFKIKTVEIKKTRSEVMVMSDDEEDVDLRRPETARARRNADDDAKAENFINKFRGQLKLQRLESLGRYNDMLRSPN